MAQTRIERNYCEGMQSPPPRKQVDRNRRAKIIDAAVLVIHAEGIEGLTHRNVAAMAQVPLAATTYYFASREDILVSTFEHAISENLDEFKNTMSTLTDATQVINFLAGMLHEGSSEQNRPISRVISELYLAAMRYNALSELAMGWDAEWISELEKFFSHERAIMISAALAGLMETLLLEQRQIPQPEALNLLSVFL